MTSIRQILAAVLLLAAAGAGEFLPGVKRILFLGDSITYAGQYVDAFELFLFSKQPERKIEVINCGLPSETVSGLSEAGHAGGKFPRPDVHERLDRVLALTKPDLVIACYGMNCGIYLPFDDGRFGAYRAGIMTLREKAAKAGAQVIHLTPAVFDPVPLRGRVVPADKVKDGQMFDGYNDVLDRYSAWLIEQGKSDGWRVIDLHGAVNAALAERRKTAPAFTFAGDGVHPNDEGQLVMARALLRGLGTDFDPESVTDAELKKLIRQRGRIIADAHLSAAGHKRPGMAKGLPIPEATAKASELETVIRTRVKR
jgi:lysophospholipase L1-like esterase